jgi:hypothetical protein
MFKPIGGITGLIVAALLVFPACRRSGTAGDDTQASSGSATAPLVQDYLHMADAAGAAGTDLDEQFLADALRKLAAALGTLSLADSDLQGVLRVAAEHVLANPRSVDTTAAVRNSLIAAADAIEPGMGGGDLQQTAESLRPDRPLADQVDTLREFFQGSSPLIRLAADV